MTSSQLSMLQDSMVSIDEGTLKAGINIRTQTELLNFVTGATREERCTAAPVQVAPPYGDDSFRL